MDVIYWVIAVYAIISLYETFKTGKNYSHVWYNSKPQFLALIIVTLVLGGLRGIADIVKWLTTFFERLMDKVNEE